MTRRPLRRHYIKQWREHRGLSLRKLADRMEIEPGIPLTSHANLQRIENFRQPYSQEILEALAEVLQVTIRDLLEVDPSKDSEVIDMVEIYGRATPEQRDDMKRYGLYLLEQGQSKRAS